MLDVRRGVSPKPETWTWLPLPNRRGLERIEEFVSLWLGTPYVAGARVRGRGADCAQLVPAFLDFMFKRSGKTPLPRLAPDTGVHNTKAALGTVEIVRRTFPHRVIRDGSIQPGDILLTRATHDWTGPLRPGHAMIVLGKKGSALHAIPLTGVSRTSLEVVRGGIIRTYRADGKETW